MTTAVLEKPAVITPEGGVNLGEAFAAALGQSTAQTNNASVLQGKFLDARKELCKSLVERDDEVEMLFHALLANEHVLFVGDPGTGKSLMVDMFTHLFDTADMFHILMTKFTKPEELFGPVDVMALKEGRYERLVAGYAPTAKVIVTDEIWKASSAIINNLLNLMQERVFKNGVQRMKCPLMLMVGSSNEWPLGDGKQELGAAFDRFLLRKRVRYVSPANRHRLCFDLTTTLPKSRLSPQELNDAQTMVMNIPFTKSAEDAFDEINNQLHKEGINPGDRRMRKSVGVAKAAAFMDQCSVVDPVHLEVLQHILWEDPIEQAPKAKEIICKIANPAGAEITKLMAEAQELIATFASIQNGVGSNEVFASVRKLGDTKKKLEEITGNRRAQEAAEYINSELSRAQRKLMGMKE